MKHNLVKPEKEKQSVQNSFFFWSNFKLKNKWFLLSGIILFTLIVYSPITSNKLLNWDDDVYVTNNKLIQGLGFDNLKTFFTQFYFSNYHPLTMLSYAIDYKIGGLNPKVYTSTNLALHICNILLVFWLVFVLVNSFKEEKSKVNSENNKALFFASLSSVIFAIHPLNVESVAWISERKNVLFVFFFLLSLLSYIRYIRQKKIKYYFLSILLFLFSLMSKGVAVSLFLSLFAIDYYYERKIYSKKVIFEKIPFLILSFIFGVLAVLAQGNEIVKVSRPFYDQLAIASYGFVNYIIKLITPFNLSSYYEYPPSVSNIFWVYCLITVLIISALVYFRKWLSKIIIFSIFFLVANLIFLIQIIPIGTTIMADRYIYLSSIGFFIIVSSIVFEISKKYREIYLVLVVGLLFYGVITHERIRTWNNSMTFWDELIKTSEKVPQAFNNRGNIKKENGDLVGALNDYNKAIILYPDYAQAYFNRANLKIESKEFDKALFDLNSAIKLEPQYFEAYNCRGKVNYVLGNIANADSDFSKAININKNFEEAFFNRANIKRESSDYIGALANFNKAIEVSPNYKEAYNFRGIVNYYLGKREESLKDFNKAIELDSNFSDALYSRGRLKNAMNDLKGALTDLNRALLLNPRLSHALLLRAKVEIKLNDYNNAIIDCDTIIANNPKLETAKVIKAMALYKSGKFAETIIEVSSIIHSTQNEGLAYFIRGISYKKTGNNSLSFQDLHNAQKIGFDASKSELLIELDVK